MNKRRMRWLSRTFEAWRRLPRVGARTEWRKNFVMPEFRSGSRPNTRAAQNRQALLFPFLPNLARSRGAQAETDNGDQPRGIMVEKGLRVKPKTWEDL